MLSVLHARCFFVEEKREELNSQTVLLLPTQVPLHTQANLCWLCQYVFSQAGALHLKPTFKAEATISIVLNPLERGAGPVKVLSDPVNTGQKI